jgi:hypothetical protein
MTEIIFNRMHSMTEEEFDRIVDPTKMVKPYVATGTWSFPYRGG